MPGYYDAMIPELLPGRPRAVDGRRRRRPSSPLPRPSSRRRPAALGALAAAALFAAVLPANVKVAVDARKSDSLAFKIGTILRLPMQWPLIAWALKVRREA